MLELNSSKVPLTTGYMSPFHQTGTPPHVPFTLTIFDLVSGLHVPARPNPSQPVPTCPYLSQPVPTCAYLSLTVPNCAYRHHCIVASLWYHCTVHHCFVAST